MNRLKVGQTVEHARFGIGFIARIDDHSYSVPFATMKLSGGDSVTRMLDEFRPTDQSEHITDWQTVATGRYADGVL